MEGSIDLNFLFPCSYTKRVYSSAVRTSPDIFTADKGIAPLKQSDLITQLRITVVMAGLDNPLPIPRIPLKIRLYYRQLKLQTRNEQTTRFNKWIGLI